MKTEIKFHRPSVIIILIGFLLVGGAINVFADINDAAPDPGHHSSELGGIPSCEENQYLTQNQGDWKCQDDLFAIDYVKIYCFDEWIDADEAVNQFWEEHPDSQEYWNALAYLNQMRQYPKTAECPEGYDLVSHNIIYRLGKYTDWNDDQHKTWYVDGSYTSDKISCWTVGTDNPSAVAGIGLCTLNFAEQEQDLPEYNLNLPCNWEDTKCSCFEDEVDALGVGIYGRMIVGTDCDNGAIDRVKLMEYSLSKNSNNNCPAVTLGWPGCDEYLPPGTHL